VTGSLEREDEPLDETAAREVMEETGIDVSRHRLTDWRYQNVYDIYPQWLFRYAPGVTRNTEHVFGLEVLDRVPVTLAPREHVAHRWLPWREAADLCFSPSNAAAILKLPEKIGASD
jgi:dATP pyrophosphohydrolase